MNLVIDVGNTFIKAGIFENNRLVELHVLQDEDEFQKKNLADKAKKVILSSVRKDLDFKNYFSGSEIFIRLNSSTNLPFQNLYKSPETLGMDRLAAAAGAASVFPHQDCLVIDAGTCITFEFIDRELKYRGGAISPGIEMRLKSLNTFTGKLPLVKRKDDTVLTGGTTDESILSGVMNGVIFEAEGVIANYKEKFPEIKVIICGGDAPFFESKIKEGIFAVPNLVLIGLNRILEYNVSSK